MKFKVILLHPITLFVYGLIVAIGGLALNDYYSQPTPRVAAPTRVAIAPRLLPPTASPSATSLPTETIEPFTNTETVAMAAEATPSSTLTFDSTPAAALEFTPTPLVSGTLGATPVVTTTQPTIRRPVTTPTVRLTPTVTTTAVAKTGDSPYAAIDITGNWEKIGPRSQLWFKTGVETSYPLRGVIALDAYGKSGIGFAVFSPEQASDLNVLTTPKGRGASNKSIPTHDLIWDGGSPKAGVWYVLLTNTNPVPVDFKLTSTFSATDHKNCFQYLEHIGSDTGPMILWTECNRPGASPP